jgi:hypothetical protein
MPFAVSSSENNRVRVFVRAYQESSDRSWEVIDTYSSGTGYATDHTHLPSSIEKDYTTMSYEKFNLGELISTSFVYQGEFTTAEKEMTEWYWEQSRQNSDHIARFVELDAKGWYTCPPTMVILAPFVFEKIPDEKWIDIVDRNVYNTISN